VTKPKIFFSHSSHGNARLLAFCEHARQSLIAMGLDVFFDAASLRPGSRFRDDLYEHLDCCEGAVLFLCPRALESRWVQFEAMILCWRKLQRPGFVLLPLFLDGVTRRDPRLTVFEPVLLGEIQSLSIDDVAVACAELARLFGGLAQGAVNDDIRNWIEDVCVALENVSPVHLRRAATALDLAEEQVSDPAGARRRIAHRLLHTADLKAAHEALSSLRQGMSWAQLSAVVSRVEPSWVHLDAASSLLRIASPAAGGAVAAINAEYSDTGDQYVRRATCCSEEIRRVRVSGVTGERIMPELIEQISAALLREFALPSADPDLLRDALRDESRAVYVILPLASLPEELLKELVATFPNTHFVALTGPVLPSLEGAAQTSIDVVLPALEANTERQAAIRTSRLRCMLRQRSHDES
jgi:hypothetical protein